MLLFFCVYFSLVREELLKGDFAANMKLLQVRWRAQSVWSSLRIVRVLIDVICTERIRQTDAVWIRGFERKQSRDLKALDLLICLRLDVRVSVYFYVFVSLSPNTVHSLLGKVLFMVKRDMRITYPRATWQHLTNHWVALHLQRRHSLPGHIPRVIRRCYVRASRTEKAQCTVWRHT